MNIINRSSTSDLYNLAEKLGLNDLIIIRKKDLKSNLPPRREGVHHENIIINLDDYAEGSHWVAVNTKKRIYFDTYNMPPPNAIPKNYKQANSRFQLQSLDSSFCGQASLLFLYYLQKNKNTSRGIKEFYAKFDDVYPF